MLVFRQLAKVVSVCQLRRIDSKFGGSPTLCEAVVGDETGTVILSLWEGQIDAVADGDILQVNNGYVSLVRGHMRLHVGKYGSLETVTREVPEVNKANDLSVAEHDMPPRESGGGFRGGSGGRSGGGGRSFGRQREEPRIHGRRRF
jgi:replication factor A1